MPNYIINKEADDKGYNEVHTTTCYRLPAVQNQVDIGWHANAIEAVAYAKSQGWTWADGCYYCSKEAHQH